MPSHRRTAHSAIALALALAVCGPAQAAQDRRSIDPHDNTATVAPSPETTSSDVQDLRSPDARDAANPTQDLRSPDARDVARRTAEPPPAARPVRIVTVAPDGFDWGDAAIGAAGTLGVVLLTAGAGTALARRRTEDPPIATT